MRSLRFVVFGVLASGCHYESYSNTYLRVRQAGGKGPGGYLGESYAIYGVGDTVDFVAEQWGYGPFNETPNLVFDSVKDPSMFTWAIDDTTLAQLVGANRVVFRSRGRTNLRIKTKHLDTRFPIAGY